ncbi:disease resistance protein [Striga asiatica]|uniref:Disease resistance protein n=1 Tax=Striga asiatica TaxID=4170 RepID=A0A5A7QN29_STRAF|nr:disease resistance protein [Striga asiatica]
MVRYGNHSQTLDFETEQRSPVSPVSRWFFRQMGRHPGCDQPLTFDLSALTPTLPTKLILVINLKQNIPTRDHSPEFDASKESTGKFAMEAVCLLRWGGKPVPQHRSPKV